MNQSIQDGLNDLFDQIIPISGDFNKKTYADSFKNAYEKYKPLFTEIAQECENSEDRQEEIEEIAAVLPDRMREVLDQEDKNLIRKYLDEIYNESVILPENFGDEILQEVANCFQEDHYEITKKNVLNEMLWCYMCNMQ